MEIFAVVLLVIASVALGFGIGREITKWECGKMLKWLEQTGALKRPFEEADDEEDG